jgi:hypothetical protein
LEHRHSSPDFQARRAHQKVCSDSSYKIGLALSMTMRLAAFRLRQLRAQRFGLGAVTRELTQQYRPRDAHALARTGAEGRPQAGFVNFLADSTSLHVTKGATPPPGLRRLVVESKL